MALSVSCTCCALVRASAECCGYLCYPSAVKRLWPLWSNPVPLSLIWCTCVVPSFLGCCVIHHMVLIALKRGKVLRLPQKSYHLYNRISQFRFDRDKHQPWERKNHRLDPTWGSTHTTGVCTRTRELARNRPVPRRNFLGKVNFFHDYLFNERTRRTIYI